MSTEASIVVAGSADDWRAWLARNCRSAKEVWLVLRHHDSGTPSLRYHEAIEQALCFGWIDGLHRRCGADSSQLRFTPRTARSRWSQLNRQRAAKMIELGLMTEHGQTAVEQAKAAGTWQLLPDEQRWAVPDDLQEQLDGDDAARTNFESFPPSSRRLILEWIAIAKRPGTRRRRIDQTVNLAALNIRANHPRNTPATGLRQPRAYASLAASSWRSRPRSSETTQMAETRPSLTTRTSIVRTSISRCVGATVPSGDVNGPT